MADDFLFGISLMANLVLGLIAIGILIKAPKKTPKNPEAVKYLGAIILGYLGGIIGNMWVSSIFELSNFYSSFFTVSTTFYVSTAAAIILLWMLNARFQEAFGD
jgi:uncharacterized membrane protein YeaQ/YmgE (transglycosylase-associated protein family)